MAAAVIIIFSVVYLHNVHSVFGYVVAIGLAVAGFIGYCVTTSRRDDLSRKISARQCDYFRYKIVKDGGKILKYDGKNRIVVYEINGEVKNIKFRYYIPGYGRRSHGHWY